MLSAHENPQCQQASWRSTNSCLIQSIGSAAGVPSHQECGVAPKSCFRHHGFSPGVHPADCDVTRFSATQQAPGLFRISLCVLSLGDWRECLLCHDSADRWTTVFTCLLLLASRPRPCLTKSYTCFINDVSVGFSYLSLLSDCRVGQFRETHRAMEQIPSKDVLVRAPCIESTAAVESLDRILAG